MEISRGRRALYITASILIAIVIWFSINNDDDIELSISDIPVEFYNAESALANKGLMLISGEDATVDLVLSLPRSMIYTFDPGRVRVIADLNSINSTGTQTISWSIIYPANSSRISVKSPTVRTVSVRVGELFRKTDVEIHCKLVGTVADGFAAGSVQLLPNKLEVWGQQNDVMKVNYAQVTLNIENARSTIVELVEYELYDYNDELIENSSIHSASSTVQVTMPVISATEIPLVVNYVESPGVRKDSFDISMDISSVTLSGDANEIAKIGKIELGEVVLAEIDGTETFTFDIDVPEGLTNLSGVSTAVLTVSNRDISTKDLTVTKFDYENFGAEDRSVEVVTSSLNVALRGPEGVLEGIDASDVTAVADLSGVTDASGTYTVPANLRIEGNPDVGTVQGYQMTVRIGLPAQQDQDGAEG